MNPLFKVLLSKVAEPFIEKKSSEILEGPPRSHPGQPSSQISKIGAGISIAALTQVDSIEGSVACIFALLVNLFFLYKPENLSIKKRSP